TRRQELAREKEELAREKYWQHGRGGRLLPSSFDSLPSLFFSCLLTFLSGLGALGALAVQHSSLRTPSRAARSVRLAQVPSPRGRRARRRAPRVWRWGSPGSWMGRAGSARRLPRTLAARVVTSARKCSAPAKRAGSSSTNSAALAERGATSGRLHGAPERPPA